MIFRFTRPGQFQFKVPLHSFIHPFIHPFIRPFIHSFILSFIHSLIQLICISSLPVEMLEDAQRILRIEIHLRIIFSENGPKDGRMDG